jgi:hypothetical protein
LSRYIVSVFVSLVVILVSFVWCRRDIAPTKENSHIAGHWAFGSINLGLVLRMMRRLSA